MSTIPPEDKLRYEGYGSAEFGTPAIRVSGPIVVNTDERGNTVAEMQVEKVPTASSIEEGIRHLLHDFFNNMNRRTPCTLRVECPDGVFAATEQTFRNPSINLPIQKTSIQFRCFRSHFEKPRASTVYWRLPIWNFHGDLRPAMSMRTLDHPMRLSDDNPLSAFEFFGEVGFVEFVPGYKEQLESQENGDRNPRVTAVMVGSVAGHATTWEGLGTWFPFDFLNLLAFASGSRVGAPWIEFLDAEGHIVKRIHTHLGSNRYETGRAFMHEPINRGGLGRLLTCAGKSAEFNKTYIRVAMNHLLLGLRYSQALEDKISHLSRALDALAGEFGLGTQYLLEGSDDSIKSRVKDMLRSTSSQIAEMARECDALSRSDVASSLRRIAERTISTPANVDRDFGLTVLSLLERFGHRWKRSSGRGLHGACSRFSKSSSACSACRLRRVRNIRSRAGI